MPEKHVFEYAILRFVPRVERQEFMNVGIVLHCAAQDFLRLDAALDKERLRAFVPSTALAHTSIEELTSHIFAFERVCAGGTDAGAIGELPRGARFRWLTAPRSTIVQTSPVHTGLCTDAAMMLKHLLHTLVCVEKS
jgi:hypothetical protein